MQRTSRDSSRYSAAPMEKNDPALPTYRRPELLRAGKALELVADLCAGPERMWQRSPAYIRQWTHEDTQTYDIRRLGEPVFGGLHRTLSAAVGMLWGRDPSITWNASEPLTKPLWDNLDGAGNNGQVLGAQFAEAAIRDGLALLLVDHPPRPDGITVTAANEGVLGLRPMWAVYERRQVLSWRTAVVNNATELEQVVLYEPGTDTDGLYGVRAVHKFRVLAMALNADGVRVATWRLLEERQVEGGPPQYPEVATGGFTNRAGQPALRLPVAVAYTGRRLGMLDAQLPLEGVAYANLGHWQYATDLKFNRAVCGFEQLVVQGDLKRDPANPMEDSQLRVGPLVGVHVEQGGSVQWVAPSGNGLAQLEKGLEEKMRAMDQLGLGFLLPRQGVQATATEARIESYAQLATLASAGKALQDAMNLAWEVTGWYLGLQPVECPVVEINTDFDNAKMDAQVMGAYVQLVNAGFPKRPVLQALLDGGRLPPDTDLDDLELEWESERMAAAERAEAEREAALLRAGPPPVGTPPAPPAPPAVEEEEDEDT
jgi:hypothetical protein